MARSSVPGGTLNVTLGMQMKQALAVYSALRAGPWIVAHGFADGHLESGSCSSPVWLLSRAAFRVPSLASAAVW